eukprot:COSAG01_NODE_2657_length_7304_cov_5.064122_5_plen_392_part_00
MRRSVPSLWVFAEGSRRLPTPPAAPARPTTAAVHGYGGGGGGIAGSDGSALLWEWEGRENFVAAACQQCHNARQACSCSCGAVPSSAVRGAVLSRLPSNRAPAAKTNAGAAVPAVVVARRPFTASWSGRRGRLTSSSDAGLAVDARSAAELRWLAAMGKDVGNAAIQGFQLSFAAGLGPASAGRGETPMTAAATAAAMTAHTWRRDVDAADAGAPKAAAEPAHSPSILQPADGMTCGDLKTAVGELVDGLVDGLMEDIVKCCRGSNDDGTQHRTMVWRSSSQHGETAAAAGGSLKPAVRGPRPPGIQVPSTAQQRGRGDGHQCPGDHPSPPQPQRSASHSASGSSLVMPLRRGFRNTLAPSPWGRRHTSRSASQRAGPAFTCHSRRYAPYQ